MKKIILIITLTSINAMASNATTTKITRILIGPDYPDKAFLTINPVPDPKADCNNNPSFTYVFDITTATGKASLSAALAAYSAGKDVSLKGADLCNIYSGTEDLSHIIVK